MNILENFINEFKQNDEVLAIALGGSRSAGHGDEFSDYDLYIYSKNGVDVEFRRKLIEKYASSYEIDNRYFEIGDEFILKDGKTCFDLMYRSIEWLGDNVEDVFKRHNARLGYTTCFLFNIKNSKILYDKNGDYLKFQEILNGPYPSELSKNIINKNLMLLKEKLCASYFEQVEKAIDRYDIVAVNHRISAYLASYFDIIFALNKIFHPGEKRLIEYVNKNCKIIPKGFEADIEGLIMGPMKGKKEYLNNLYLSIKECVKENI